MITISLVIPVYGVRDFIEEFADSVLGQSYPAIQYIFVNDGTRDDSITILRSLIDSRYSYRKENIIIVDKENAGLPAARKTGMEYVTGDYVYHVDPDDWLSPDSVGKIASVAEATGSDVIYFHYVKEYKTRSSVKKERFYTISEKDEYVRNMYNHRSYGTLCNKCVRHGLYRENTISFPMYSYAEDCYLTTQLVGYASSLSMLDEVVYHYRKNNPHSITRQSRKRRREEYAMNFLDLYEKYKDVPREENPVAAIFDDILIQAGWYSIRYGFSFFRRYPYLAGEIGRAKIRGGSDVALPLQILTKIIAVFNR